MAHTLVRITKTEDNENVNIIDQVWCVTAFGGDTTRTLCTGEAIDGSSHVEVDTKTVKRGGITCEECLDAIKHYKAIRL